MMPDSKRILPHLRSSLVAHAVTGRPTGGFLEAVLENDLMGAFSRADFHSRANLLHICSFMHCVMPARSYGSAELREEWQRGGGILGLMGEDEALSWLQRHDLADDYIRENTRIDTKEE